MRIRLTIAALAVSLGCGAALDAPAQPNDQVYRVLSSSCGPDKRTRFSQTGFRAVVQGEIGLVTALHGVVGCDSVLAVQEEDLGSASITLRDGKVSVPHDVVFFVSETLARQPGKPLQPAPGVPVGEIRVIGYPQQSLEQLSHRLELFEQPRRTLADQFGGSDFERALARRKSPSVHEEVLLVSGALQSGYSGAPVMTAANTVLGIGNGGLAQGFADINWIIPFAGIPWQRYDRDSPEIRELAKLDASSLFHSPWTSESGAPLGGVEVSGTIYYNGRPASQTTRANPVIELIDVEKWQPVPIDVRYDNTSGRFTLADVPPGKYTPQVRLEAGYPFHIESGGDYHARISGLNPDIVVAPHDTSLRVDLQVVQGIRLKSPVDNQVRRHFVSDPPENFYPSFFAPSAELFEWDAVPGAAYYKAFVLTVPVVRAPGQLPLAIIEKRLAEPRFRPGLGISPAGTQYMFTVEAFNASNQRIGIFSDYYKDGSGGWLLFRVIPGPQTPGGATPTSPAPEPQALRGYLVVPAGGAVNTPADLPAGTTICTLRGEAAALRGVARLARFHAVELPAPELHHALETASCRAVFFSSRQQAERVFPPTRTYVRLIEVHD